ncbi:MAG: ATP-binding protein [Acutalibacteraceae bacterium]
MSTRSSTSGRTLSRVFRMLVPLADRQSVKLTASVEKGCTILSFEDDAYQILFNLVENGIKYNRENGSVHVRVRQEDDTVVIDDGGYRQRHLPKTRWSPSSTASTASTRPAAVRPAAQDLSLSIVHEMVGRNFGTITGPLTVGEGSCFTVTFPSFGSGEEGDPDA